MAITSGEDKTLKRLREICLKISGTTETSSWGHANWRVGKKLFAAYEETPTAHVVSFFASVEREEELLKDPRFFLPRYTDHHGWLCLKLDRKTDWAEIRALIVQSHCLMNAPH
ncbi:MAG: MmcQ/YjbR family DNA-binding protein [Elusimicrobiota bacterium]